MSLKFRIIGKCFQDARNVSCGDADFLLEEDGWDDFNYHVMYHLHATTNRTHTHNEYLGPIRIMKLEQHEAESYLLSGALGYGKTFESLPENFFSLSTSIELYEGCIVCCLLRNEGVLLDNCDSFWGKTANIMRR